MEEKEATVLPEGESIGEENLASEENEATLEDTEAADALADAQESQSGDADYERLAEEDLDALKREFYELGELSHISELDNPLRYAALRDLGLTPKEAYLATRKTVGKDTRSHLFGAVDRAASTPPSRMSQRELGEARELFSNMSDADIQRLFKRVTS